MEDMADTVGVGVQTFVMDGLPLLIASVPATAPGIALDTALRAAGLRPLERVVGGDLPLGAKVGFRLEVGELRLANLDGEVLLRANRTGVDDAWAKAAVKLRGTMLVMVSGTVLPADLTGGALGATLDALAAKGQVFGAVVGVEEDRMRLPLLF